MLRAVVLFTPLHRCPYHTASSDSTLPWMKDLLSWRLLRTFQLLRNPIRVVAIHFMEVQSSVTVFRWPALHRLAWNLEQSASSKQVNHPTLQVDHCGLAHPRRLYFPAHFHRTNHRCVQYLRILRYLHHPAHL